jgi:tripeptidyl-peptidase-1
MFSSSDPSSPKYGQYWSAAEVHDMFAPPEDTVAAVKGWLTSSGIDASRILHYDNKGWLAFDATAEEAEGLFGAEFHEHEHSKSPSVRIGCDK